MSSVMAKTKLTLTIDEDILIATKNAANKKGVSLSHLVEVFFQFFSEPNLFCFSCGVEFITRTSEECAACGWLKCPECDSCRCNLSEEVAISLYRMRKVYEQLLAGRVK